MTSHSPANDTDHDLLPLTTDKTTRSNDKHKQRPTLPPISSMNEFFASKSWPPPSTSLSVTNSLPSNSSTSISNPPFLSPPLTGSIYRTSDDKLPISPAADGGDRSVGYFDNNQQQRHHQPFQPSLPSPQQQQNQGCSSPASPPLHNKHTLSTSPNSSHSLSYQSASSPSMISPTQYTYQQHSSTNYSNTNQPSITSLSTNYTAIHNIPTPAYTTASTSASSLLPASIIQLIGRDVDQVINQCNTLSDNMHQKRSSINQIEDYFSDSNLMRPWLDDMVGKANEILNALLRIRKHQIAAEQARIHRISFSSATTTAGAAGNNYHSRQRQHNQSRYNSNQDTDNQSANSSAGSASYIQQESHRWTAHKFASSSGGILALNSSLRKRGKRPGFQGRCHSCNISETPEWRRGPNGARTLCNACGLHYAKLNKKKSKQQQEQSGSSTTGDGSSNNEETKADNANMMEEDDSTSMS